MEKWFADNPKRRVCKVGFVYNKTVTVRRGHVKEDIQAAVEAACAG